MERRLGLVEDLARLCSRLDGPGVGVLCRTDGGVRFLDLGDQLVSLGRFAGHVLTDDRLSMLELLAFCREREILQLIAEGLSSKEVAALLSISVRTVESHRSAVMGKLDLHKVAGLVRFAIREGLIAP